MQTTQSIQPCVLVSFSRSQQLSDVVGGGASASWQLAAASIWIPHAKGPILIDAAVGRQTLSDLASAPFWFRNAMGDWSSARPLVDLLHERLSVEPDAAITVLSTHAHWDHVGALRDLPGARPLFWKEELRFLASRTGSFDHAIMPHILAPLGGRLASFEMDGPPYEGFGASHDLLGDGTIIAVPLPGHTPGSTGYFVNSNDGKRWFFTGDATWSLAGIERPAHKPFLASVATDFDDKKLAETISLLSGISRARPGLIIIPAHDLQALSRLPSCGQDPRESR